MPLLTPGLLVLAAIRFQHILDRLMASLTHHNTLWFLGAAGACLAVTWVGHRREWNGVTLTLTTIAGIGLLFAAAAHGLLGDWARRTGPVSARAVQREIRASHGGPISDVPIGGVCKNSYDCNRVATCVRLEGDDYLRCQRRCEKDGSCPNGGTCQKAHGGRVCLK